MKHLVKSWKARLATGAALVAASPFALAGGGGGVDYSALVAAVDFETVADGVLGVAAALITVYIVIKGVRLVMGFVRGG